MEKFEQVPVTTISLKVMRDRVHSALRSWRKVTGQGGDLLEDLLLFQDAFVLDSAERTGSLPRITTNSILRDAIDRLEIQSPSWAKLLRLRFIEGHTMATTSGLIDWTMDQVRHNQRKAIEALADIISREEMMLRQNRRERIESKLPPPTYQKLFGQDEVQATLIDKLIGDDPASIVVIMGLGGIGKTALADSIVRSIIPRFHFHEYAWLRADPFALDRDAIDFETATDLLANEIALQIAPEVAGNAPREARMYRVRQVLKQTPHLIVIDNLETISNTTYLIQQMLEWSNPSRFLLTTRVRPTVDGAIYTHPADELNLTNAGDLLRFHAKSVRLPDLASATDEQVNEIYRVVGGNPLAIKLVVSMAKTMPLGLILNDIENAHTNQIEALYERVYRRVWLSLSPSQRLLLQAMPLVAEAGGTVAQLRAMSGLPDPDLWPAIHELINRSLIELRGNTWERLYGIHRLTTSFLQTNINRWEDDLDLDEELAV